MFVEVRSGTLSSYHGGVAGFIDIMSMNPRTHLTAHEGIVYILFDINMLLLIDIFLLICGKQIYILVGQIWWLYGTYMSYN